MGSSLAITKGEKERGPVSIQSALPIPTVTSRREGGLKSKLNSQYYLLYKRELSVLYGA